MISIRWCRRKGRKMPTHRTVDQNGIYSVVTLLIREQRWLIATHACSMNIGEMYEVRSQVSVRLLNASCVFDRVVHLPCSQERTSAIVRLDSQDALEEEEVLLFRRCRQIVCIQRPQNRSRFGKIFVLITAVHSIDIDRLIGGMLGLTIRHDAYWGRIQIIM